METFKIEEIEFSESATGALRLKLADGTVHEPVHCISLFPLSGPDGFVSIHRDGKDDDTELGIVENLRDLPSDQRKLVQRDIRQRYFLPEIEDIRRVVDFHGVEEWDVLTDRGPRTFYVGGGRRRNTIAVDEHGMVLITDVEKCRYRISDPSRLSARAALFLSEAMP